MTPPRTVAPAAALALSLFGATLGAQDSADPTADPVAFFRPLAAAAERLVGMPELTPGGAPGREVRIYVSSGVLSPDVFVRIWVQRGAARGARGVAWRRGLRGLGLRSSDSTEAAVLRRLEAKAAEHRAFILDRYPCGEVRADRGREACVLREPTRRDWATVLRGLDSLGVFDLPPQPIDAAGNDGFTLVVAIRDARGYRAYTYWTPRPEDPDPNTRAAAEIMHRAWALFAR